MAGESQPRTTALARMRDSPLFSLRRLTFVLLLAFSAGLLDMTLLHVLGIGTLAELASQTLIHTVGIYLGFTLAALLVPVGVSQ